MDLNRYDDILNKARCESVGEVILKQNGKWSYRMRLHVMPMDDIHLAEGPEFNSAIEAANALFKTYGLDGWSE